MRLIKRIKARFVFWAIGLLILFLLANTKLRPFPHIIIIFWGLLPLLSIIFSKLSDRKLKARLTINPGILNIDEKGQWICELKNESHLMAFFLRFPDLFTDEKKKKLLELMLQPQEEKKLVLSFTLPHVGPYTLKTREPIYEDLLGFIRLNFDDSQISHMVNCYLLPSENIDKPMTFTSVFDELGRPVPRKNLTSVSDEVYSIDPMERGESFSHVHWKLSARMQEWMVKHYSDYDQEPARIIIHTAPSKSPSVYFTLEGENKLEPEDEKLLDERDFFLNYICSLAATFLDKDKSLHLADCRSQYKPFRGYGDMEGLRLYLANIPFDTGDLHWKMESFGDKPQLVFIQKFGQSELGNLIHFAELGIYFICFSFKSMNDSEMIERVEKSIISCIWLDEGGVE